MGRFTLRLPETLHQELESRADQEGVSLNQYIVYALTRQIGTKYTIEVLPERQIQEQRSVYDAALSKLSHADEKDEETIARRFLEERASGEPEPGLSKEMIDRLRAKFGSA